MRNARIFEMSGEPYVPRHHERTGRAEHQARRLARVPRWILRVSRMRDGFLEPLIFASIGGVIGGLVVASALL